MISDCHVHTEFSGDSKAPQNAQVQAALELGMKEICITDHHDPGSSQMTHIDFTLDLPAYLRALEDTVQAFEGKIRVLKGIELGLMLREKDILTRLGAELPVDYIIGASHFLDGLDVYDPATRAAANTPPISGTLNPPWPESGPWTALTAWATWITSSAMVRTEIRIMCQATIWTSSTRS